MGAIFLYLSLTVLIGMIFNFYGRKLYFGMIVLSTFGASMFFFVGKFGMTLKGLAIGAIVGLILALLSRLVYKAGVFLMGAISGFVISILLCTFMPQFMMDYKKIIVISITLVVAVCAVLWCELFIIISTATNGSYMIASAVCFLILNINHLQRFIYVDGAFSTMTHLDEYLRGEFMSHNSILLMIVSAVLFIFGFSYQKKLLSQNS